MGAVDRPFEDGETQAVRPEYDGLGCTQQHLRGRFRVVATSASTSPAELQRLADHYQQPLTVRVTG